MRVLLADDDAMNRELYVAALEGRGHEVVAVSDGAAALARALAERFDALVLDIQMPGRDGLAVARALRDAGDRRPVIAVSAAAFPADVAAAREAGFDAYLTKPITGRDLVAAVERAVARPE